MQVLSWRDHPDGSRWDGTFDCSGCDTTRDDAATCCDDHDRVCVECAADEHAGAL